MALISAQVASYAYGEKEYGRPVLCKSIDEILALRHIGQRIARLGRERALCGGRAAGKGDELLRFNRTTGKNNITHAERSHLLTNRASLRVDPGIDHYAWSSRLQ